MRVSVNILCLLKHGQVKYPPLQKQIFFRNYHGIPFLDLYQKTTGESVSEYLLEKLKRKHPTLETLSHDRLQCTLQILKKFDISAEDACKDPHIFTMNPITMDNYGEILKECGFIKIIPINIIRYHTLVRSKTIAWLKKESLIREDLNLEELLFNYYTEWSAETKSLEKFIDASTNILTVRMSVLQKYLNWKLGVTSEEFDKYCRQYNPIKHKPMTDIQKALDIAQNDLNFKTSVIKRNGFIISSDPVNTKFILENVESIASVDIREAIRIEPAILKNNYNSVLEIKNLLQEYEISEEAQRRCFKVYCMCPSTVKERLEELRNLKEYQILKTNTRVLSMVVHKRKMMNRLEKIQVAKKQCFSLNHLVSSKKVFDNYIGSFGNKGCGRDLVTLITSSVSVGDTQDRKIILKKLKRHKFWLHAALKVIDDNIQYLKNKFKDEVILNNCQLLLYPLTETEQYIECLLKMRSGEKNINSNIQFDYAYKDIKYAALNDNQILSLVLYEIEKKYHFSGDGIWARQDGVKVEAQAT